MQTNTHLSDNKPRRTTKLSYYIQSSAIAVVKWILYDETAIIMVLLRSCYHVMLMPPVWQHSVNMNMYIDEQYRNVNIFIYSSFVFSTMCCCIGLKRNVLECLSITTDVVHCFSLCYLCSLLMLLTSRLPIFLSHYYVRPCINVLELSITRVDDYSQFIDVLMSNITVSAYYLYGTTYASWALG